MHMLPITLTIAGAAALLNLWLGFRISQIRRQAGVSIGDGGNLALTARMRAQANFIENAPFFLILLGLVELANGSQLWLWAVSILFILARIAHALGMDRTSGRSRLRMIGMIVSTAALVALAVYALSLPYLQPADDLSIRVASR